MVFYSHFLLLLTCFLILFGYVNHSSALAETNPFANKNQTIHDEIKISNVPVIFSVNKTSPYDGQIDVILDKKFSINFNSSLNVTLGNFNVSDYFKVLKGYYDFVNSNVSEFNSDYMLKGKYSLSDYNHTIVFKPRSKLIPNTVYTMVLAGKDECNPVNKKFSNASEEEKSPLFTLLTGAASSSRPRNNTVNTCTPGNLLDRNYVWYFRTELSPPIISKPEDNSTTNARTLTVSGSDPDHSELIKLFAESSAVKKSKLKEIGSSFPSPNGDWSVRAHIGKLQDGKYQLFATAFDSFYNRTSESQKLALNIDRNPPVMKVPSQINVITKQPEGLTVFFQSNATDNLDGFLDAVCSPLRSGAIFPVGISKVTCIATDKAKNVGSASFDVNVTSLDPLGLSCNPPKVIIIAGSEASMDCKVENKLFTPVEVDLTCSKLDKYGIQCYINGNLERGTTSLKEGSSQSFNVLISSKSNQKLTPGLYPFTISANCKKSTC
jgi:hypothetical protein